MKNIQVSGNLYGKHTTLVQINKTVARRLFNEGKEVFLQSCKLKPINMWQSACSIHKDSELLRDTFEANVNSFSYYNLDSERGGYVHYYCEYSNAPKK